MNAAARLVGGLGKYDLVTPVLRDTLHWLPIQQRIELKVAVLAFDCVRGTCPSYFCGICTPLTEVGGKVRLCCAHRGDLCVPSTRQNLANTVSELLQHGTLYRYISVRQPSADNSSRVCWARNSSLQTRLHMTFTSENYWGVNLLTYLLTYLLTMSPLISNANQGRSDQQTWERNGDAVSPPLGVGPQRHGGKYIFTGLFTGNARVVILMTRQSVESVRKQLSRPAVCNHLQSGPQLRSGTRRQFPPRSSSFKLNLVSCFSGKSSKLLPPDVRFYV